MDKSVIGLKKYNGIDLCKFIMAFLVISIHTHPLEKCTNNLVKNLAASIESLAVPFFFIATGFLLFIKMSGEYDEEKNLLRVKNYIKKTTQLYLIWTIIYIPLSIYGYIYEGIGITTSILKFIRGLFFIGEHFYSWPLWYLLSVIVSLTIIYVLLRLKVSEKSIVILSFFVFILAHSMTYLVSMHDELTGISQFIIKSYRSIFSSGRLFTGLAYVSIGMYIAKASAVIKSKKLSVLLIIIGFIGSCVLPVIIKEIALLIAVSNIFLFVVNLQITNSKLFYYLRKASSVMYLTHMMFFFIYSLVVHEIRYYGLDAFVVTVACCLFLSVIVILLEKSRFAKWISYLFG